MVRRTWHWRLRIGAFWCALATWALFRLSIESRTPLPGAGFPAGDYAIRAVIDGDTLELADGTRVRLIGVDTPEAAWADRPREPFADEATRFALHFVRGGHATLQFDRERFDRYDRLLAYVLVDGKMLNEALVAAGLARAQTQYNYASEMKARFRAAETSAKSRSLGIWSARPAASRGA